MVITLFQIISINNKIIITLPLVSLAALVSLAVLPIAVLTLAVVTVAVLALHAPVAVLLTCKYKQM